MYYNEALVKDWSNPKEITIKEIVECVISTPENKLAVIVNKAISSGRIKSIEKQLDKDFTDSKFNSAANFAFVLEALGDDLLFEFGGTVVRNKDSTVIYENSDMPTYIKTYTEALLTVEAIKQVEAAADRHRPSIKSHNWKRDSKEEQVILPKDFKAILTKEVAIFLAEGGKPTKRLKRLSTKIISLSL